MKISEMMKVLSRIRDEHGDVELTLGPDDNPVSYVYVVEGKKLVSREYQARVAQPARPGKGEHGQWNSR